MAAGPFIDDGGKRLDVLIARTRVLESLIIGKLRLAHRLAEVLPHLGSGAENKDVIVVAAGSTLENIAGAAAETVSGARDRLMGHIGAHHRNAAEIEHRLLHRDLDLLPLAGLLPLDVGGAPADRRMHPGPRVSDSRAGFKGRSARKSGEPHRAAGCLRDHVEALV